MTRDSKRTNEALLLEPLSAAVLLAFALFVNRGVAWPWMWTIDLIACVGAAVSYRWPAIGAVLTSLSLAVWLPFESALVSVSAMAFYINTFAAWRKDLFWKVPLLLGMAGLAYLVIVRKMVERPSDRLTSTMVLLIFLVIACAGGVAFRWAAQRIQRERDTGHQRLQDLQSSLARELHDSVAQTLSSAAMRANIVMGEASLSPLALDQLERIADECRSSAHDLRQLLSTLRDEPERELTPGPLADVESLRQAVRAQAERLRGEGFMVVVDLQVTKLSAARCQTLAAIAVEAANNIMKHAKPRTSCRFSIVQSTEDVLGEFSNVRRNSRGVRQGFGLTGVQERLTLLDGTCAVVLADGGWTLQARLPLGLEDPRSRSDVPVIPALFTSEEATA